MKNKPPLPQNSESRLLKLFDSFSERAVIHAAVFDGKFEEAAKYLEASDFAGEIERRIWSICWVSFDELGEVGLSSVTHYLAGHENYRQSDLAWLMDLDRDCPEIVNVAPFAKRVKQLSVDRAAYSVLNQLTSEAEAGNLDLGKATEALAKIPTAQNGRLKSIGEIIQECGGAEALFTASPILASTPWPTVNRDLAGGFRAGELAILAGRPGMGKTSIALQLALWTARRGQVVFFSLEMKRRELLHRMVAAEAGIHLQDIITGHLTLDERQRLNQASGSLSDLHLDVQDKIVRLTESLQLIKHTKPKLVVIDYLGLLLTGQRAENRNQEVSTITRALKLAAMQNDCAILAISQLSRDTEKRQDHRPVLSDLRDSGSLEQDADVVMFVYRPVYYKREAEHLKRDAEIILAKQRNGASGLTIPLQFRPETCQFYEIEEREQR